MVISQAPKSLPCQRKLVMLRSARKKVSEVRSSARVAGAGAVEEEPVDRGLVVVVEQAERLGVAAAGQLDQGDQAGALGLGLLRGRGQVGVAEPVRARPTGGRGAGPAAPPSSRAASVSSTRGRRRGRLRGEEQLGDGRAQGVEPARDVVARPTAS